MSKNKGAAAAQGQIDTSQKQMDSYNQYLKDTLSQRSAAIDPYAGKLQGVEDLYDPAYKRLDTQYGRLDTQYGKLDTQYGNLDDILAKLKATGALNESDLANYRTMANKDLSVEEAKGYDPATLAALRGEAIDSGGKRYDADISALKAKLGQRGAGMPAGGDWARGFGSLYSNRESDLSSALRGVTTNNFAEIQKQKLANRNFALSERDQALAGLSGVSAAGSNLYKNYQGTYGGINDTIGGINNTIGGVNNTIGGINNTITGYGNRSKNLIDAMSTYGQIYNPSTFTTAANSALGSRGDATQTYANATKGSGWLSALGGAALGAGSSFLTGGLSNIVKGGSFLKPKVG